MGKKDFTKSNEKITEKEKEQGIKAIDLTMTDRTVTCIILRESKGAILRKVPFQEENAFSVEGNTYFILSEGIYLSRKNVLVSVYLEGISTPLAHKNIKKKLVSRKYIDPEGNEKMIKVQMIEGLKYDSKIIDIITNRILARRFLHVKPDMTNWVIGIVLTILIILGIINVGLTYYNGGV